MLLEISGLTGAPGGPFNLALAAGDCLVISGPSGIGKSLLLRMIADLDENTGTVSLNGVSREAMPAPQWRRQVLYVAAESGWWAERVREHMQPADGRRRPDAAPWPARGVAGCAGEPAFHRRAPAHGAAPRHHPQTRGPAAGRTHLGARPRLDARRRSPADGTGRRRDRPGGGLA